MYGMGLKAFWFVLLLLFYDAHAETIYQWRDPWGQMQYSKTPVPGAMISDLTELPEPQETTEQQKQDAMVRKLQEMQQDRHRAAQMQAARESSEIGALVERDRCMQLRNLMVEVQSARLRQYQQFPFTPFLYTPHYYGHLQLDISREIRNNCR